MILVILGIFFFFFLVNYDDFIVTKKNYNLLKKIILNETIPSISNIVYRKTF